MRHVSQPPLCSTQSHNPQLRLHRLRVAGRALQRDPLILLRPEHLHLSRDPPYEIVAVLTVLVVLCRVCYVYKG
jgi:hypothetical protein